MKTRHMLLLACMLAHAAVYAQQPPAPPRTLLHADLQGVPGWEALIQLVDIPPGAATPKHLHPDGHEIAYVLDGETAVEIEGVGSRSAKAGEVLHITPNVPHLGRNTSGTAPLKLLIVRIKDKTKPVMVPVK